MLLWKLLFSSFPFLGDGKDLQICIDPSVSWDGCTMLHPTCSMAGTQEESETFGSYIALRVLGHWQVDSFNCKQVAPCCGTSSGAQTAVVYCLSDTDIWLHILEVPLYHWVSDHASSAQDYINPHQIIKTIYILFSSLNWKDTLFQYTPLFCIICFLS